MLRIDSNILWTIINLLILYALMKHFLFQPIHDILEKRKQEIESDFALANQQKQEALESKNKANQQLENMQTICDGMLADAKEQASLEYEQIIADANKKSDEMIEQARIKTIEVANEEKAKETVDAFGATIIGDRTQFKDAADQALANYDLD